MLTNNAKCIFCDNVTCFGTNKCCSTRSHLPGCFIKAPTSCLHGYSVSLRNIQGSSTCFWEAMFATRPIALAVTSHSLPWKEFKNALFSFSMATSLVLFVFGHGVETSHLGDVSAQELCQASEDFSLELPPAHMKVTHLMST